MGDAREMLVIETAHPPQALSSRGSPSPWERETELSPDRVAQRGQVWDGGILEGRGAQRRCLTAREFRESFLEEGMFELCHERLVGAEKPERWKRVLGRELCVKGLKRKVSQGHWED